MGKETDIPRALFLAPEITLRKSDNGWYRLDWDGRPVSDENREWAIINLANYIEECKPPVATSPTPDGEGYYRSMEDALAELRRGRQVYSLEEVEREIIN